MNFLQVFSNDLKTIVRSRAFRISLIAIICIPVLYSLLYLKAFWNPYGSLKDLPVAVVNLDVGDTSDGKNVNYGDDLVDSLKENHSVKWSFVSKKAAYNGLKGDKYYSIFIIEKDFSEKVLSAKNGTPLKAGMKFVCNEKKNFLAAQVSTKIENALKQKVVSTITKNYVEGAFNNLNDAKDGMMEAADGSTQLNDGVSQIKDNIPELLDGTNQLGVGSEKLYDGQVDLNSGISTISSKLGDLTDGLSTANSGSSDLNNGLSALKDGMISIRDGVGEINKKAPELVSGIGQLYDGSNQVMSGMNNAKNGSSQLADGTSKLYQGYVNQVYPGIEGLASGAAQIEQQIAAKENDINTLSSGAQVISANSGGVAAGSTGIKNGYESIKGGLDNLITASGDTSAMIEQIGTDLSEAKVATDINAKDEKIDEALNLIMQYQNANSDAADRLQELSIGASQLESSINNFDSGVQQYTGGAKNVSDGTINLISGFSQVGSGVSQLSGGLSNLKNGLDSDFGPNLKLLNDKESEFNNKLPELYDGMNKINQGLSSANSQMVDFSKLPQLYQGTVDALNGANKAYSGSSDLNSGISQLYDGSNKLYSGSQEAVSGSSDLVSGQEEMKNGVGDLVSKVPTLQDGIDQLYGGSQQLSTKLSDGANKLNDGLINTPEDMGTFVSDPVVLDVSPINPVANYGSGFAPYFMNLSLWIGALMMFFVVQTKTGDDEHTSNFSKVVGKYLAFTVVAICQAVLVGVAVYKLGLRPTNIYMYFGMLIFCSFVYLAIVQCLVTLFGDLGKLLSIVLLILQLTGCAGTFPLELSPRFFSIINPAMPFTYAVQAMREICGATTINLTVVGKDVLVLGLTGLGFLALAVLFKRVGEKFISLFENRREKYLHLYDKNDSIQQ